VLISLGSKIRSEEVKFTGRRKLERLKKSVKDGRRENVKKMRLEMR